MMSLAQKKKLEFPHVLVLLTAIMLLVVVASWFIPSGLYTRITDPITGVTAIDPESFSYVERTDPIGVLDFFVAMHTGVSESGNIIITLFFSAGMIQLMKASGAIDVGMRKVVRKAKGKEIVIVILLHLVFTAMGAVGLGEGTIALVPLCTSVVMTLGYDRMLGTAAAVTGVMIGFTSGLVNVYTTGTAQEIVGLPMFSGMGFRFIGLVVFFIITTLYLMNYARKIKKDPNKSYMRDEYLSDIAQAREASAEADEGAFTWRHALILLIFLASTIAKPIGSINFGWGMPQMNATNLIGAVLMMVVLGQNINASCRTFLKGSMGILPAALAIGIARAIVVLMDQVMITDTVIHSLVSIFEGRSPIVCIILIYIVIVLFNALVVSGSGKAVILMPIIGPMAQVLGINQQVMVHTYIYGDGFTNYFWPTSGAFMAMIELCEVDWIQWVKFAWKLLVLLSVAALCLVLVGQVVGLGPF